MVLNASRESPPNVIGRNIVSAFDDSLPHATDGFAHIRDPDEVQLDLITALLRLFEHEVRGSVDSGGTEPPPAAVTTNGPIFLRKTMMFSVTSSIDSRILTRHGC